MILALPTKGEKGKNEEIDGHFGRSRTYTLYDTENDETKVIPNKGEHMGGTGKPPELLNEKGVDIMLCRNLGRKAVDMFNQFDIEVYTGAKGKVKDAIKQYNEGNLNKAVRSNACKGKHN
ncbi:MAG: putative Fe-Mo cluster-binding protein, NifX family [Candidatus Methanohalarchaeum thermophilum]|uniref:Fe-Mo cluster-binding protein, NifX family n=1 Tax=Methanohalarchaeum thermophilum TaxID=1903181 RepID=A0A1Q6DSF6_METT1|nr:MAG: putative Fe-Mo cluster-binding protein, NifX family [Candidatus Methanohalarchaeum thermophilum]